jgi:hypothetical protein
VQFFQRTNSTVDFSNDFLHVIRSAAPKLVSTTIDVDIILYNNINNTYLHLGIDKDKNSDFYYPKSFYDRNKNDHIVGQTPVAIKSLRIEMD